MIKKKLASFLLTICMVIGLIPLPSNLVYAATSGSCGGNLTWTLNSGTITIKGTGDMYSYSNVRDVPWYSNRSSIKKVAISKGVTSIGSTSFYYCKNLTDVSMGSTIKSIGDRAFMGCENLKNISWSNSIKTIGKSSFAGTSIVDLDIPDSATTISQFAFNGCDSLETVFIGSNVTIIDEGAFSSCDNLYFVDISDSVKTIGEECFYGCDNLEQVRMGNGVETIGNSAFKSCELLSSAGLPDTIKHIGDYAFYYCRAMSNHLVFPENIETIGEYAYYACTNLDSISFDCRNYINIGKYAFANCNGIKYLDIYGNIEIIPESAFRFCDSLTEVTMSNSIKEIAVNSFDGCDLLKDVYYIGTKGEWDSINISSGNEPLLNSNIHPLNQTYTITYNANGGSDAPNTQLKMHDATLTLSSTKPTRTGYSFINWNTKADGSGIAYNSGSSYTANSNVTLYAYWNPWTYTIAFNLNGGEGNIPSQTKTQDVNLTLSTSKPTRTGYSFVNWNTKADGSGTAYKAGGSYTANSGTTLYAQWTANTYKVTFNAKGGTTPTTDQTVTYNSTYGTLPMPERTGWTFKGWYTALTGGTQITSDTKVTITSTQTLYAQWEPDSPCTSSTINTSGTTHTINTEVYKINSNAYMFAAGYENGNLIAIDSGVYNNNSMEFVLEGYIDEVKVMAWDDISTMRPLCGAETIPVTSIIESSHPYDNDCNETKTFVYSGKCKSIDVTFSSDTFVENNWDYIYVLDGADNQIGVYTGSALAGVTINIPGNTVKIKLTSDSSVNKYGYKVDKIVINR